MCSKSKISYVYANPHVALNSNTTSLSAVDDTFRDDVDDSHDDPTTTTNLDQSSDIIEGRDDGLKWVKSQIIKAVGMFDYRLSFHSLKLMCHTSHQPELVCLIITTIFLLTLTNIILSC